MYLCFFVQKEKFTYPLFLSLFIVVWVFFFLNMCISGSLKSGRNRITPLLLQLMMGIHGLLVRVTTMPPPKTAQSSLGAMM